MDRFRPTTFHEESVMLPELLMFSGKRLKNYMLEIRETK